MRAPAPPAPRAARRPAAVIFDMDGLMLDTEPLAARAWTAAAAQVGIAFDDAVTPRLVGRNFPDCAALIRAHHGDDYPVDALMRAWHEAYDAIVAREGIALKPGLVELLAWLERERVPRAVATSTRRSRAQAKLVQTDLARCFAALVGGDEVARGKPAPDIYLEAAARLRVAPDACVALEDSEPGVLAALAAGMTAIMIPDLAPPSPELLARAPPVFASLSEVHAHFACLPMSERVR
jgi:HAD superfamily hydrolase (TIGR01509 family)